MKNLFYSTQQDLLQKHIEAAALFPVFKQGMALTARFIGTQILSANALTEQLWPATVFEYALQNMQLSKFLGQDKNDKNALIVVDKSLSTAPGNKITMRLRPALSGAGGGDGTAIEGNEQAMQFFNFPVEVHERSTGVRSQDKLTLQYTKIDFLVEATAAIGDWIAEQLENDLVYAICGLGNQGTYVGEGTSQIQTVNEKAPSTNRVLYGGQTVTGVEDWVTTINAIGDGSATDYKNYKFGTKVIDKAKLAAQLATPKIRPVMIAGKGYYVMFIHPLQTKDLRADPNWNQTQQTANVRGLMNPLFTRGGDGGRVDEKLRMFDGAIGVWNDVILYELERLPTRIAAEVFASSTDTVHTYIASGTARVAEAVLCGAQAAAIAWAQMWKNYRKNFDYERLPGLATDSIYGVSKTRFRDPGAGQSTNTAQDDFAVISVFTATGEV